jgi:hypothetical protein
MKASSFGGAFFVLKFNPMGLVHLKHDKWAKTSLILLTLLGLAAGVLYACAHHPPMDVPIVSSSTETSADTKELTGKEVKHCAGVDVNSLIVSTEYSNGAVPSDPSPSIMVDPHASGETIAITELGPVLGSMDSRKVKTEVVCTEKGFAVTAIVTRSADYKGALAKNVLWRPRINIAIVLRNPEVNFEGTWRMRLTTGAELDHAETPPYPEQRYPATITKTIR